MKKTTLIVLSCLLYIINQAFPANGQEHAGPLGANPQLFGKQEKHNVAKKTTAITLPFFEDFTGYDLYPDNSKWIEKQVYINNTICVSPISRGVATFDALNELGHPWDPSSNNNFRYTDSLTSQPFDLTGYTPNDSLYLSFFYQPQGLGFFPLVADSLVLFMRIRYGDWLPVWKMQGASLQPFKQVMIPITDTLYFYNSFQFRFANIAALNYSDAIWNLDYVRFDAGRNMYDTLVNDIAYSSNPTPLLNDYTSMPYRQFIANTAGERALSYRDSIHNNYDSPQPVTYGFTAKDEGSGTILQSIVTNTATLNPTGIQQLANNAYTTTVPAGIYDKVVFENKYYVQSTTATGSLPNDTIVKEQVFDNYLAYDDGSAEQSYYLSLFPSLPGKIEIEHHLNVPDSMQGMAIYFGRTAPSQSYKSFSIEVYSQLAGINGAVADNLLYVQDPCYPGYADTVNNFWIYKFDTPLPLPAGTFYTGVMMPAESSSDSLYFGFDLNRIGGNHAYYNVLSSWNPSLLHGAIMMRPLMGQDIKASGIEPVVAAKKDIWEVFPNPASNEISISFPGDGTASYIITNIQGQTVKTGNTVNGSIVDVTALHAGMYFINISCNGVAGSPKKFIKL